MDFFFFLTILSNAAMNIHVQDVVTYTFNCLGYRPKGKAAESHGNSMITFLRSCRTVLQNGSAILYSHL